MPGIKDSLRGQIYVPYNTFPTNKTAGTPLVSDIRSGKYTTIEDSTTPGNSTESTNTKVCLTMRRCSTTHCTLASKQAILRQEYNITRTTYWEDLA